MMKLTGRGRRLYRIVAISVLVLVGCSSEEPAKSTADSSTRTSGDTSPGAPASLPRILIIGDSITAGYGLEEGKAFPALLQSLVDSAGYRYVVVNAGLSGETTSGGARRIDWLLRGGADIVLIELGGNDGLRGIPPEVTEQNLRAIIATVRQHNPDARVILGGMRMPMNMGDTYRRSFEAVYPRVAQETDVLLIPHILEGVGGVAALNQTDGIHPTAEGQAIIADLVWKYLEPLLKATT